jgi:hypothetical protein
MGSEWGMFWAAMCLFLAGTVTRAFGGLKNLVVSLLTIVTQGKMAGM